MADQARHRPTPLGPAAYHGVVGDYVRAVAPHTEGDLAAILVQALVCSGNAMGRGPHFMIEATRHGTNLFCVVVGDTAAARKGTSLDRAFGLVAAADPEWGKNNHGEGGLSTPEGLINAVRDRPEPAVEDKRFLAAMGEFAETLMRMKKDNNPLGTTLRSAWDANTLRTVTRNEPMVAHSAHVSVIGHITEADLNEQLGTAQIFNGFGNRFLWVAATRSKSLPFGGELAITDLPEMVAEVRKAIDWAKKKPRRIDFDDEARSMWPQLYAELGLSEGGRFGAITDRAEAQVRRLALTYAALDRSRIVGSAHLNAALEVWRYCEASSAYIFAHHPPDPVEKALVRVLRERERWTSRSEISRRAFKGGVKAYVLDSAFSGLLDRGEIESRRVATRGRTRHEYRLRDGE